MRCTFKEKANTIIVYEVMQYGITISVWSNKITNQCFIFIQHKGRQVTVTEFEPAAGASTSTAAVAAFTAAPQGAVLTSGYHPPRRDLGSRPVNVTCPYCTRTGKTRTNYNCGDVSNYMEIAYLFT